MEFKDLVDLRSKLEPHFSDDTRQGKLGRTASSGHCAAVSFIVNSVFGGNYVSVTVEGQSHWLNLIGKYFVDLTGDQFGSDPVVMSEVNRWQEIRQRLPSELKEETKTRARLLAERAGIKL